MKTILIILALFYGIRFLLRLAMPYFLKSVASKLEKKMREQRGYTEEQQTKVGETVIDRKPQKQQKNKAVEGEYIDFEEVG